MKLPLSRICDINEDVVSLESIPRIYIYTSAYLINTNDRIEKKKNIRGDINFQATVIKYDKKKKCIKVLVHPR